MKKRKKLRSERDITTAAMALDLAKLPSIEKLHETIERITQNNLRILLNYKVDNNYDRYIKGTARTN
jgi:hypothetical protein